MLRPKLVRTTALALLVAAATSACSAPRAALASAAPAATLADLPTLGSSAVGAPSLAPLVEPDYGYSSLLSMGLVPTAAPQEEVDENRNSVSLLFGRVEFEEDTVWDALDLDEPPYFGIQTWFGFGEKGIPGIETGLGFYGTDETFVVGTDVIDGYGVHFEGFLGFRLSVPIGNPETVHVVPYASVGGIVIVSSLAVEDDGDFDESDADVTAGVYFQAGVAIPVTRWLELGANLRVVRGTDVEFDASELGLGAGTIETDVDSERVAFYLGFRF